MRKGGLAEAGRCDSECMALSLAGMVVARYQRNCWMVGPYPESLDTWMHVLRTCCLEDYPMLLAGFLIPLFILWRLRSNTELEESVGKKKTFYVVCTRISLIPR